MNKSNLIFLDTETTDIGPTGRLCQVAYKFQGKEYEGLFKPPVPISVEAMSICHITNKMVNEKEFFSNSQMKKNLENIFSDSTNILVAHNASFDAEILKREGLKPGEMIDTFKVASQMDQDGLAGKYNLQYLRYFFDLEVENVLPHSALGDVRVLESLFDYLFARMEKSMGDGSKVIEKMIEISRKPVLLKKFSFGKYIGEKVRDIAQKDANYLLWLLDQKIQARERGEGDDENWIYTLDYYVGRK